MPKATLKSEWMKGELPNVYIYPMPGVGGLRRHLMNCPNVYICSARSGRFEVPLEIYLSEQVFHNLEFGIYSVIGFRIGSFQDRFWDLTGSFFFVLFYVK